MARIGTFLIVSCIALVSLTNVSRVGGQQPQTIERAEVEKRMTTESNRDADQYVRTAFENQDIATLVACVEVPAAQSKLARSYKASTDNQFKAQLAVSMLRSETIFAPFPPLAVLRGGEGGFKIYFMEMIRPVISEHIGNVPSTIDLLADAQLRLRVADQLEASITNPAPKNPGTVTPEKPNPQQAPSSVPASTTATSESIPTPTEETLAASSEERNRAWLWVIGIIVFVLAAALFLKGRALPERARKS